MGFICGFCFSWKQPVKLRKSLMKKIYLAIPTLLFVMNNHFLPGAMSAFNLSKGPKVLIGRGGVATVGKGLCKWQSGHDFKNSLASVLIIAKEFKRKLFNKAIHTNHLTATFR